MPKKAECNNGDCGRGARRRHPGEDPLTRSALDPRGNSIPASPSGTTRKPMTRSYWARTGIDQETAMKIARASLRRGGIDCDSGNHLVDVKRVDGAWVFFVSKNQRRPGSQVVVFVNEDGTAFTMPGRQ